MKKVLMATLAFMATTSLYAEQEVLIDYTDKWNLFSKFEGGFTDIDGDSGILGELSVGGMLNDKLALGIAGAMLLDTVETESQFLEDIENTDFWYGGAYTEYVFNQQELVYMSLDLLIGGGELNLKRISGQSDASTIFVLEPGVNVMVNVTETFSLGLGINYRFIQGVDSEDVDDSDVSGLTGSVFLRFTQF
jgi:hypothetical protein